MHLQDRSVSPHANVVNILIDALIGPKEKEGVVNNKLQVHGIQNLRICDASVFPDMVSGHPVSGTAPLDQGVSADWCVASSGGRDCREVCGYLGWRDDRG